MSEVTDTDSARARRLGRSPAYPSFPINKALENVKALYAQEKEYAAPLAPTLKAFGYGPKSSGGRQALATMKYYGLIDVIGEGDARRVKASDVALKILRDPREDDTEKRQLIRRVALTPAAHKLLLDEYPAGLASDGTVLYFLHEGGFNEQAARELLAEFKETASQIGLYEPSNSVDKIGKMDDDDGVKFELPVVKVGDRIQCTIAGVDTFPDGATVLGFSDDGQWVFTDQSDGASPLKDVSVMEAAPAVVTPPPMPAHLLALRQQGEAPKPGMRKAVFPLDDGDVALIFPEGISASGLSELGQYLDIFLKKEAGKKRAENTAKIIDEMT